MGGGSFNSYVLAFTNGNIVVSYDPGKGFTPSAGNTTRTGAISIGNDAGKTSQKKYAVAIGDQAGRSVQGNSAVALGNQAGRSQQGTSSVAIGNNAAKKFQGEDAVAIGNQAGLNNQKKLCRGYW